MTTAPFNYDVNKRLKDNIQTELTDLQCVSFLLLLFFLKKKRHRDISAPILYIAYGIIYTSNSKNYLLSLPNMCNVR